MTNEARLAELHEARLAADNGDGRALTYLEQVELDRLEAPTLPAPRIDAQVDLGFLFATVHASIVGDSVGAHVDLDGTVIADTSMRPLPDDADLVAQARAVRSAAVTAIIAAHREIGIDVDTIVEHRVRSTVASLLPLGPYADEAWADDGGRAIITRLLDEAAR